MGRTPARGPANPDDVGRMRIHVKDVLEMLATRMPEAEILRDFPYLEPQDIDACLHYAAAQSDHAILVGTTAA